MQKIRNMKHPRLATILAGLALFIALGGTAAAAGGLINGKNIKKGTVTAKQIKNRTITKGKLSPKTVKSLKGAKGATGEKGATGAQGVQGVPGQDGVISADSETEIGPENVAVSVDKTLASINVPSGKYVVNADFNYSSASSDPVNCVIKSGASIFALTSFAGSTGKSSVALNAITGSSVTTVSLVCNSTAAGVANNIHLVTLPVAG